jgi:hypothetical protein
MVMARTLCPLMLLHMRPTILVAGTPIAPFDR